MHVHDTNKIVKKILKQIAQDENKSFQAVKKLFAFYADPHVTHRFWEILAKQKPNHKYIDVFHCPGCDQFDLE